MLEKQEKIKKNEKIKKQEKQEKKGNVGKVEKVGKVVKLQFKQMAPKCVQQSPERFQTCPKWFKRVENLKLKISQKLKCHKK